MRKSRRNSRRVEGGRKERNVGGEKSQYRRGKEKRRYIIKKAITAMMG